MPHSDKLSPCLAFRELILGRGWASRPLLVGGTGKGAAPSLTRVPFSPTSEHPFGRGGLGPWPRTRPQVNAQAAEGKQFGW